MTFFKLTKPSTIVSIILLACSIAADYAQAADDPLQILKKMTDYVAAQQSFSAVIDTDIEVITNDLQKVQFASSGKISISRPNKLRVDRSGGYANMELVFDGTTTTVYSKNLGVFAKVNTPGTTDELVDRLRSEYGMDAPGADLLLTRAYEILTDDIVEAKYIGEGVIGGVECDHLAVRDRETDWQIWIERGEKPIPRKYVITSKSVTAAPQYTLVVRDWQTGDIPAEAFVFKAPSGVKEVGIKDLPHLDEVPEGDVMGAKK